MKGFILAAGLGTRLKPWTDHHPKALAPVGGVTMLERIVEKFHKAGITDLTINCHHFADQIKQYIKEKEWSINIAEEIPELLETGGAILNASRYLAGDEPILIHNVDILSNANFKTLGEAHQKTGAMATLLVSDRKSTRKLIFDREERLIGWHSVSTDEYRPAGFRPETKDIEKAFSGIYVVSPAIINEMKERGWEGRFSIMDFFLSTLTDLSYRAHTQDDLSLIDIGKPDSLNRANMLLEK